MLALLWSLAAISSSAGPPPAPAVPPIYTPPIYPPQIVPPPSPAAPPIYTPPRAPPMTRPSPHDPASVMRLFSADDYPPEAVRLEQQGIVAYSATVGPDGRVASCDIVTSSGSASLDAATCSIIQRRARFRPASDQQGRPIAEKFSGRISWVLPVWEPEQVEDYSLRQIYMIDANRQISQCLRQTGENPSKIYPCGPERGYFQAIIDRAPESLGVAERQLVFEVAQFLGEAGALVRLGERHGQKVIGRNQIKLTIDDQGTVVDCELEESVGDRNEGRGEAMCAPELNKKFEALDPGVPNRGVRYLTRIGALYFRAK